MIIIRYTGGLGNQMFIYVMQNIIMHKFPGEEICADLTRYSYSNEHNGFDIRDFFDVNIQEMNKEILRKIAPFNYVYTLLGLNNLFPGFSRCSLSKIDEFFEKKRKEIGIISVPPYHYDPNIFYLNQEKKIYHYKANFINPTYWGKNISAIRDLFVFKKDILPQDAENLIKEIENTISVSLHVRKGDYKGNYNYDICNSKYYMNAYTYLLRYIGRKKHKVFIFSDEPHIQFDFLKDVDCTVIDSAYKSGVTLYLMSRCKHNIIANSTFSYWGGVLNDNKDRVVIAPLYVYRTDGFYIKMPVPYEWVQINNL